MKRVDYDISNRILEGGEIKFDVNNEIYLTSLANITKILFEDLKSFLNMEGRNFGIMKTYIKTITKSYNEILWNDKKIYDRVTYLFKPVIKKEYERLVKKYLSPADSIICIILKLLNIIDESINYQYRKELKPIKKVISRIYSRIGTKSKNDPLFKFGNTIRLAKSNLSIGKYPINSFSVSELIPKNEKMEEEEKILMEDKPKPETITEINL